jgi:hypothetical protein
MDPASCVCDNLYIYHEQVPPPARNLQARVSCSIMLQDSMIETTL